MTHMLSRHPLTPLFFLLWLISWTTVYAPPSPLCVRGCKFLSLKKHIQILPHDPSSPLRVRTPHTHTKHTHNNHKRQNRHTRDHGTATSHPTPCSGFPACQCSSRRKKRPPPPSPHLLRLPLRPLLPPLRLLCSRSPPRQCLPNLQPVVRWPPTPPPPLLP